MRTRDAGGGAAHASVPPRGACVGGARATVRAVVSGYRFGPPPSPRHPSMSGMNILLVLVVVQMTVAEPCTPPEMGVLEDDDGDYSRQRSRYQILQPSTEASGMDIVCAPEFVGTAKAVCLNGTEFTYSGCAWRICAPPGEKPEYSIENVNATTGDQLVTGVTVSCAQGFEGYPEVKGCVTDGEEFEITGCEAVPEKTSGAAIVAVGVSAVGVSEVLLLAPLMAVALFCVGDAVSSGA